MALEITLRDLLARLYPGPRKPRPNEYWPRLDKARPTDQHHESGSPFEDPATGKTGARSVVLVSGFPRGPGCLDEAVRSCGGPAAR